MIRCLILGPTGIGKSTHGPYLAKSLQSQFVDLDQALQTDFSQALAEILRQQGRQRFWELSKQKLEYYAQASKSYVLAVGAGSQYAAPLNWAKELSQSKSLALWAEPHWLWKHNQHCRQDPRSYEAFYVTEFSHERQSLYKACRWQLNLTNCSLHEAQTRVQHWLEETQI